jgi:hypothetical protein
LRLRVFLCIHFLRRCYQGKHSEGGQCCRAEPGGSTFSKLLLIVVRSGCSPIICVSQKNALFAWSLAMVIGERSAFCFALVKLFFHCPDATSSGLILLKIYPNFSACLSRPNCGTADLHVPRSGVWVGSNLFRSSF